MTNPAATAVTLRPATLDDVELLLGFMDDFNAGENIPLKSDQLRGPLSYLMGQPNLGRVSILQQEGRVIGYAILTWGFDLEFGGRDAFLTEIYLVPEARYRRLGDEGLALVEALAAAEGASAVHLMVRHENTPALRMYTRRGWETPQRRVMTKWLRKLS